MRLGDLCAALALLASPALARAQEAVPERASFYLLLRGDTIFDERSARTSTQLSGEFRDRLRGARVSYTASLAPTALVTRIDMRTFRSAGDTVGENASFIIDGDSVIAQIGAAAPVHLPSATGALVILNPAVSFLEQMALRARSFGGDSASFTLFVLGAPQPIVAVVRRISPDSIRLDYAGVTMRLAVSSEGRVLGGALPAQGVTIVRGPAGPPLGASRPDDSAPRDDDPTWIARLVTSGAFIDAQDRLRR